MEEKFITQDDLLDISELTQKLNMEISEILSGNNVDLAGSALIGSFVSLIAYQCKDIDKFLLFKKLTNDAFDATCIDLFID